jgi:hypothetical protein
VESSVEFQRSLALVRRLEPRLSRREGARAAKEFTSVQVSTSLRTLQVLELQQAGRLAENLPERFGLERQGLGEDAQMFCVRDLGESKERR